MQKIKQQFNKLGSRIKKLFSHFKLTTPVSVLLGAVIIAGSILGYGIIMRTGSNNAPLTIFSGKPIDSTDYIEGNKKSSIYLVEYSDPQCPYCISAHPTVKALRTKYENKIAFVYRHFPLTSIHPYAFDESRAIACAGMIGGSDAYYKYIDAIYGYKSAKQNSGESSDLPPTGKSDLAAGIGLDLQLFNQCMDNQNTYNIVNESMNDGVNAGVQGTPTSFVLIKTKKGFEVVALVDGARPLQYFEAAIEQALSR